MIFLQEGKDTITSSLLPNLSWCLTLKKMWKPPFRFQPRSYLQKAEAKISNYLITNKLFYSISHKKLQKPNHPFPSPNPCFKKRTQRYRWAVIHSKWFQKIIAKNLWNAGLKQENNFQGIGHASEKGLRQARNNHISPRWRRDFESPEASSCVGPPLKGMRLTTGPFPLKIGSPRCYRWAPPLPLSIDFPWSCN